MLVIRFDSAKYANLMVKKISMTPTRNSSKPSFGKLFTTEDSELLKNIPDFRRKMLDKKLMKVFNTPEGQASGKASDKVIADVLHEAKIWKSAKKIINSFYNYFFHTKPKNTGKSGPTGTTGIKMTA